MKSKIFKPAFLILAALAFNASTFAQDVSVNVAPPLTDVSVKVKFNERDFQVKMDEFGKNLKAGLKDLSKNISVTVNNIAPKINLDLSDLGNDLDISTSINNDIDEESHELSTKIKNYSKSYSLDANDRIKLSNQYGKITVNTWDKREVKVDVQIKAEADGDDDAQKLLDGVQINDSKNGDQVSFRTEIERNSNGSWKLWNWGNGNKKHKLTINYNVYMPAKTDLDVEDSYGSIELPDLDGKVRIRSSYGSVAAQNLSNPLNELEGSYGSMKLGNVNGGKLDYSYGSVNIEECNNLKADLSYGSFKLGKLKSTADIDMSYEGGFKIGEVAGSVKKLNINTSYSGVALGLAGNCNFDFDVTTSYGGFNYSDDKVTVTSKNPPDGSKHIGTTRNYKGHVGKGGTDAQVNIHTSYGGVNFE